MNTHETDIKNLHAGSPTSSYQDSRLFALESGNFAISSGNNHSLDSV